MRISSSWLTLGASLSLLIPAWTANAQEFTIPLRPFTKVTLEPDTSFQIATQITSEASKPQEVEITKDNVRLLSSNPTKPQYDPKLSVKVAAIPEVAIPEAKNSPLSPTVVQDIKRSQPEIVSSTEPARVIPSSGAYNSGQLDPEQTLVVPTTPSEVKLEITKAITLNEVLDLIEKTSSAAIQARITLDRARASLREAQAALLPTMSASAQYSYTNSAQVQATLPASNANPISSSLTGTVGINYNLFDSGVNNATIRNAEYNVKIAESNLNQIRQTIRLSVVTAYYSLQNTDENVRIQTDAVTQNEQSLKDTEARERAGVGTKLDVLTAQVALANARQALASSQAAQLVARRELCRQLNYAPTVELTAADKIEPVPELKLSIEDTILLAVRNRAELDTQRLTREVARGNAALSLAKLGPQIAIFANANAADILSGGSSANSNGFGGVGLGYQIGATLTWSLYDGGKAAAQVDQYKADQATAESVFEQNARQARYDAESAYINQRSLFKQIDTATLAVTQAREALRLSRLQLNAGVGTQLQVITAEAALTTAEGNLVQAIIGYNQARANLERAVNRL